MVLNNSSKKQFVSTVIYLQYFSLNIEDFTSLNQWLMKIIQRQKNLKRNRLQQQPFNKKLTAF